MIYLFPGSYLNWTSSQHNLFLFAQRAVDPSFERLLPKNPFINTVTPNGTWGFSYSSLVWITF